MRCDAHSSQPTLSIKQQCRQTASVFIHQTSFCTSAQGKAAAKPDLPKRHNPIASLFPTHVISLEAAEPALLSRCLALAEQEQAAARAAAAAAAAADGKPVAAAAGKGKPVGPMTHNNEKDFK